MLNKLGSIISAAYNEADKQYGIKEKVQGIKEDVARTALKAGTKLNNFAEGTLGPQINDPESAAKKLALQKQLDDLTKQLKTL